VLFVYSAALCGTVLDLCSKLILLLEFDVSSSGIKQSTLNSNSCIESESTVVRKMLLVTEIWGFEEFYASCMQYLMHTAFWMA